MTPLGGGGFQAMQDQPRPSGCLLLLLAAAVFGLIVYDLMNTDPDGDGGGTRFAVLVLFGLLLYGCARFAAWISRIARREPRGFPVEPTRRSSEADPS
jgi:hypothetical protein